LRWQLHRERLLTRTAGLALVALALAGTPAVAGCALVDAYILEDPDSGGTASDAGPSPDDAGSDARVDAGGDCADGPACGECCPESTQSQPCGGDGCSQVRVCTARCRWSLWGLCNLCD
jgi:hypothetical protein